MKFKIILFASLSFLFVFSQGDQKQTATEDNPGYVDKLIDFNLLSQGSRFDQPFHTLNWIIQLEDAVNFDYNEHRSYLEVASETGGGMSAGLRINFPKVNLVTKAFLKPPLTIPFVAKKYKERGVLDNVSIIRFIKLKIWGNNYPYTAYIVIADKQGNKFLHRFDQKLSFFGWREITWENPKYRERFIFKNVDVTPPVYPSALPGIRFDSLVFVKNNSPLNNLGVDPKGSDFITYVKEVNVTYDKAVPESFFKTLGLDTKPDFIDNESVFKIEEEYEKKVSESYTDAKFNIIKRKLLLERARKNIEALQPSY